MAIKKTPEVLAPAGNLTALYAAVDYGADAVYVGGQEFGMRAAPDNFTIEQLSVGVQYAHARKVPVYLTLNILPGNDEVNRLPESPALLGAAAIAAQNVLSDPTKLMKHEKEA